MLRDNSYNTDELLDDMRDMGFDQMARDFESIRKVGLESRKEIFSKFTELTENELQESGFIEDDVDAQRARFLMIFMYMLGYEKCKFTVDRAMEEMENEDN